MADAEEVFSDEGMLLLVLALRLCLRYPGLHGRHNDANTEAQAQVKGTISFSCACVVPGCFHFGLLCLCLRRTCKPAFRADYLYRSGCRLYRALNKDSRNHDY